MTSKSFSVVNIGLCVYILGISLLSDGSLLMKVLRLFIVGITILYTLKSKEIKVNKYIIWVLIFSSFCFISIYWAESRKVAFNGALTVLWNAICTSCIVIISSLRRKYIYNAMKAMLFASVIYGGMIFLKHGIFVFMAQRGVENISANDVGIRASIGILLALILMINKYCKYKYVYITSIIINVIWIILSASRKSLLMLLIPISIYFIFKNKKAINILINILLTLILLVSVYYLIMKVDFLYEFIGNRIETMINGVLGLGKTDGSTMFRMELIEWGKEWFYKKPMLGYGIDNYRYLLGFKNTWAGEQGTYAHNNFIEVAVSAGLIGFIIYYWIYFDMLISIIKKFNKINTSLMLALGIIIGILINEYALVTYSSKYMQGVIGVLWVFVKYESIYGYINVINSEGRGLYSE